MIIIRVTARVSTISRYFNNDERVIERNFYVHLCHRYTSAPMHYLIVIFEMIILLNQKNHHDFYMNLFKATIYNQTWC